MDQAGGGLKGSEGGVVCVASHGVWHFVSRRIIALADGTQIVWASRPHRKRLFTLERDDRHAPEAFLFRCLWMPRQPNWWIGILFALGAALFAAGCVLFLVPATATLLGLDEWHSNAVFFAGSIPFTMAAYLQLYQAANAPPMMGNDGATGAAARRRRVFFGWQPGDIGWLSCALQFAGTVLFNFNTFDPLLPGLNWFQDDLLIWAPNIFGSILFLASGHLAFAETCHAHFRFEPSSLSWWIVAINWLGCLGFMVAALLAIFLPVDVGPWMTDLSLSFTLQGAVCFFVGAILLLPEAALPSVSTA